MQDEQIGKYFKRSEFACKCGCGLASIDPRLVQKLDTMREKLKRPIKITSGCRCAKHNTAVGGEEHSAHLPNPKTGLCEAVDISAPSSQWRFLLVGLAFKVGFWRIGVYKNQAIVHVDINEDNPQCVLWVM